jgi:hypothetical protein
MLHAFAMSVDIKLSPNAWPNVAQPVIDAWETQSQTWFSSSQCKSYLSDTGFQVSFKSRHDPFSCWQVTAFKQMLNSIVSGCSWISFLYEFVGFLLITGNLPSALLCTCLMIIAYWQTVGMATLFAVSLGVVSMCPLALIHFMHAGMTALFAQQYSVSTYTDPSEKVREVLTYNTLHVMFSCITIVVCTFVFMATSSNVYILNINVGMICLFYLHAFFNYAIQIPIFFLTFGPTDGFGDVFALFTYVGDSCGVCSCKCKCCCSGCCDSSQDANNNFACEDVLAKQASDMDKDVDVSEGGGGGGGDAVEMTRLQH